MSDDPDAINSIRDYLDALRKNGTLGLLYAKTSDQSAIEDFRTMSDADLAVLKHRADQSDARMERIEGKLDRVDDKLTQILIGLGSLPTKGALWGMIATVVSLAAASVAVVVSILTWVQGLHLHS